MKREQVCCPVCEADNNGLLFQHADESYSECEMCGLIYINPRLRQEEVESFFEGEYYELDQKKVEFSTRLRYFEEMMRRMEELKDKGRVLDIGCGPGHFLEMSRRAGWQPVGVKLSAQACAVARKQGFDVAQGSLRQAAFADEEFDVVTLWNVLDHMTQPLDEMREVHRILKPGGMVLMRVPNAAFHRLVKAAAQRSHESAHARQDHLQDVHLFSRECAPSVRQGRFQPRTHRKQRHERHQSLGHRPALSCLVAENI